MNISNKACQYKSNCQYHLTSYLRKLQNTFQQGVDTFQRKKPTPKPLKDRMILKRDEKVYDCQGLGWLWT